MNCPNCRSATEPADRFCHDCGTRLIAPTASEKRRAALRQARAVAREGGRAAAQGAKLASKGLETQRGRSVVACAAAGSVLPVVGTISGATLGAAAGLFRKL